MGVLDKLKRNKSRRQATINVPNVSADIAAKNEEKSEELHQPDVANGAAEIEPQQQNAVQNVTPNVVENNAPIETANVATEPVQSNDVNKEPIVNETPQNNVAPVQASASEPIAWNGQGTDPNLSTADPNYPTGTANNPQQINAARPSDEQIAAEQSRAEENNANKQTEEEQGEIEKNLTADDSGVQLAYGNDADTLYTPQEQKAKEEIESLLGEENMRYINSLPEGQRDYAMARMIVEQVNYNKAKSAEEDEKTNEKKEKVTRTLAGILSMVGALGNLVNATTSRNGRSVEVANIPQALEKNQADREARRLKSMENLRKIQQDYDNARGSIINDAWKRHDLEEKNKADRETKERVAAINAETRERLNAANNQNRVDIANNKNAHDSEEKAKDRQTKITVAEMNNDAKTTNSTTRSGGGSGRQERDDLPRYTYNIGGRDYNVGKDVVRRLADVLPNDLKSQMVRTTGFGKSKKEVKMTEQEIDTLINGYVNDADRHERNGDERAAWERFCAVADDLDRQYQSNNDSHKGRKKENSEEKEEETGNTKKKSGIVRKGKEKTGGEKKGTAKDNGDGTTTLNV